MTKLLNHVSNEDFVHGVTVMYKGLIIDIQRGSIPTNVHVPSNDQDSETWEDTILFSWEVEYLFVEFFEDEALDTLKDYQHAVKQVITAVLEVRGQKNAKKIQARLQKAADNGIDIWNTKQTIHMMVDREFPVKEA